MFSSKILQNAVQTYLQNWSSNVCVMHTATNGSIMVFAYYDNMLQTDTSSLISYK